MARRIHFLRITWHIVGGRGIGSSGVDGKTSGEDGCDLPGLHLKQNIL